MKKHKQSHTAGNESDFMHVFLEKMASDKSTPFEGDTGDLNLRIVMQDLFTAGTETTSTTLLWLVLLLATHPDIQQKMQQEIDANVPRNELPSTEHRPK